MSNIRKGDNVVVISGSDKGKKGSVLKVFPNAISARPRRNRPES